MTFNYYFAGDEMSFDLNKKIADKCFGVPDCIVDKHIRIANGDQLKVLLWILRNSPENPDIDKMCRDLRMKKDDAADYLQYWVNAAVLSAGEVSSDSQKESVQSPTAPVPAPAPVDVSVLKQQAVAPLPVPSRPTSSEIVTRINESPELGHLFSECQKMLGKTIGYDGQCTILLIHDHYGLPADVILTLIGYCVSIGKGSYSYIEKVAKDWCEKEIDTFDKACAKVERLTSVSAFWKRFCAMSGISTPRPTAAQTETILCWLDEFRFSDDVIFLAYEEMAEHTGKFSMNYMDKILRKWYSSGVRTVKDTEKLKAEKLSSVNKEKSTSASYDIDEFDSQSLGKELKYERKKR